MTEKKTAWEKMQKYANLAKYFEHYLDTHGKAEHVNCLPNLIIWIREVLDNDSQRAADLFNMTDEEREDFYSWGSNSRWAHTFTMKLDELIDYDVMENTTDVPDILMSLAEEEGDPDIEAKFFKEEEPKKQVVYVVRQTQTCENFYKTAIYVCSTEEEATRRARLLNQTYGSNCKFSEDWDYEDIDEGAEDYHFYDVEAFQLDEKFCG